MNSAASLQRSWVKYRSLISDLCPVGTNRDRNMTHCEPCEAGAISSEPGTVSCQPCGPGTTASDDKTHCGTYWLGDVRVFMGIFIAAPSLHFPVLVTWRQVSVYHETISISLQIHIPSKILPTSSLFLSNLGLGFFSFCYGLRTSNLRKNSLHQVHSSTSATFFTPSVYWYLHLRKIAQLYTQKAARPGRIEQTTC